MATKRKPNAMHSAETVEHYTPVPIVEAARFTLGGVIDLDPASCEVANRTVKARRIFTKEDNGLALPWAFAGFGGNTAVFCNPPGGKDGNESVQKQWWRHGAAQWRAGTVDAMVWVAFKVDFLQVTQTNAAPSDVLPLDGAVCYPSERIAYYTPSKTQIPLPGSDGLDRGDQPPHASCIIYLPSRRDPFGLSRFTAAFSPIGEVRWDQRYIDRLMRGETCRRS